MKTALKILGVLVLLIILSIAGALTYVSKALPNVADAPDITIEQTKERVERGEFLANNVFVCMDCHSKQQYEFFGPTIDSTSLGQGGKLFGLENGFPGDYYAKNLTPYNLGSWTDGEIFRAITTGVDNEGNAMFPIMPYPNYGKVDKDDIYDIIAYLRSLEPIEHEVPDSKSAFPMNFIINLMPMEPQFAEKLNHTNPIELGKYLVTAASCADCHTPLENGQPIPGMKFSGGMEFPIEHGSAFSANITPDKETGIGSWSKEMFIEKFKQYQDSTLIVNTKPIQPGQANTEMPWRFYSNMSEEELGAIFEYLRTQEPVSHKVDHFVATN